MKDQPGRLDQAAAMLSAAHQPCKDLPLETEGRNVAPQKQAAPFQAASVIDKDPPGQICPIFVGFDSLWPTRLPSLQEHGVSSLAPCSGASCVLCFGACSHPGEGFALQISSYSAGGMPSCPAPAASPPWDGWALGSALPWGARDISGHLQHAQGSLSRLP